MDIVGDNIFQDGKNRQALPAAIDCGDYNSMAIVGDSILDDPSIDVAATIDSGEFPSMARVGDNILGVLIHR